MFTAPTYLVLDLPPSIAAKVHALRLRHDPFEAQLPPEITVAGSSGLGVLAAHQDADEVFRTVRLIGSKHLPFVSSFVSMERFPGVPVFWLKPRDRMPFDTLHQALAASSLRFEPNPFPFNPHCTISATVELTASQEDELLSTVVPGEEFALADLCIYQMIAGRAVLLESFSFNTSAAAPTN